MYCFEKKGAPLSEDWDCEFTTGWWVGGAQLEKGQCNSHEWEVTKSIGKSQIGGCSSDLQLVMCVAQKTKPLHHSWLLTGCNDYIIKVKWIHATHLLGTIKYSFIKMIPCNLNTFSPNVHNQQRTETRLCGTLILCRSVRTQARYYCFWKSIYKPVAGNQIFSQRKDSLGFNGAFM